MDQPKARIDQYSVQSATDRAKEYASWRINSSLRYLADAEKKDREKTSHCAYCYYMQRDRIGGAAITMRPCGICNKEMSFGSTATDMLCLDCGLKHELCVQCGADIKLRPRRKFNLG